MCTMSTRCWTMQPSRQMEDSIIAHEDANVASMDTQVRTRAFASCVELSHTHTDNGLFARLREHSYQQGHLATSFLPTSYGLERGRVLKRLVRRPDCSPVPRHLAVDLFVENVLVHKVCHRNIKERQRWPLLAAALGMGTIDAVCVCRWRRQ